METRNQNPGAGAAARPHPGAAPHSDPDRARDELKQQGKEVRDQARAAGQQIKNAASDAGHQAKEKASELAQQTQRKAAEYTRQAKTQGAAMLDQQRQRAAEQIHTVSEAVHRAADKFRQDKDDNIAGYVDAAADEVDRLGNYLRERDLNSLWRDAQSFGRRRPEWFLGGMFVAGLALTRFLKASAERRESFDDGRFEGRGYGDPASSTYMGATGFGAEHEKLPDPSHATRQFSSTSGAGASRPPGTTPIPASTTSTTTTPGMATPAHQPTSPGQA